MADSHSGAPRLLDRLRQALRVRHYSRRTEDVYVGWVRRYILFHHKTHPAQLGARQVGDYLTSARCRSCSGIAM